jgi:hypothetical protein
LPRNRSSRSRQGSAFRATAISACAFLILVTQETIAYPTRFPAELEV